MDQARDAKTVRIYRLLRGYWQLAEKLDEGLLESYVEACADVSVEAVSLACQRIASGQAGLNTSFPPSPADIAERASMLDAAARPRIPLHNGLIEMDWGHGRVDLRGLTTEEQDKLIELRGMTPDGRNAALLTLEEKRASLEVKALPPGGAE